MTLIFKDERDREFFNLCLKIKQGTELTVAEFVPKAIESPASSFFLTYKGYERIIGYKGEIKGAKAELYKEIKERYSKLNCKSLREASIELDSQPAPKFYISKQRAITLYYELVKKHNDEVRCRINFYNRVFGI